MTSQARSHSFGKSVPILPSNAWSSTLIDYNSSRRRMDLFSNSRLPANLQSLLSPCTPTPESAATDFSWNDSTLPPYDVTMRHVDVKQPETTASGTAAAMQEAHAPASGRGRIRSMKLSSPRSFRARRSFRSAKKAVRPGISVDTSVICHDANEPRQIFPSPQLGTIRGGSRNALGSTPATLEDVAETTSWDRKVSILKRARGNRMMQSDAAEHQSHSQLTPQHKVSIPDHDAKAYNLNEDMTPSESAITIGFLSSPDLVSHHQKSCQQSRTNPAICVTPAQEKTNWNARQRSFSNPRPRPASSIYSQATPWIPQTEAFPPLPAFSANLSQQRGPALPGAKTTPKLVAHENRDSSWTTFEEDESDARYREQTMSADTMFEEEATPRSATFPKKQFSKRGKGLAIDTTIIHNSRRSQGWWNVITTPFENLLVRTPTSAKQQMPQVPDLPRGLCQPDRNRSLDDHANSCATDSGSSVVDKKIHHDNGGQLSTHYHFHLGSNVVNTSQTSHGQSESQHVTRSTPHGGLGVVIQQTPSNTEHQVDQSKGRVYSADDRDVSLVLDEYSSASKSDYLHPQPPARHRAVAIPYATTHQSSSSRKDFTPTRGQLEPPLSGGTETPSVGIAVLGTVGAAKAVQNTSTPPQHSFFRAHAPPPLATLPLRQQQPSTQPTSQALSSSTCVPHQDYQLRNLALFAGAKSPPMTSFPGPMSFGNSRTTEGLTTTEVTVHSTWDKDNPPKPTAKKTGTPKRRGCCAGKRQKTEVVTKEDEKKKKKKRLQRIICICILGLVVLIVALASILSKRRGSSVSTSGSSVSTSSQVQWLNLTGFPPIPIGKMDVVRPTLLAKVDGCSNPATLWSCDLPKEVQQANLPGASDQPTLKLDIRFSNDTIANKSLTTPLRFARDLGGSPFTPSPSPPSQDDQKFLGRTSDHNIEPFEGEDTPFFFTILSTAEDTRAASRFKAFAKRDTMTMTHAIRRGTVTSTISVMSATSIANFDSVIPSPSILSDGSAAPANLWPSPPPSSQPLKLFNRGTDKEHYGFYIYFDRSIFLKSVQINNSSQTNPGELPADQNGGSQEAGATARCTWTETRFLLQIWTRANATLLVPSSNSTTGDPIPGSFPYPITITTDRHGGTQTGKMIYCYALDEQERPVPLNKTLMFEDRGFGGTWVNGGGGPFHEIVTDPKQGGPGGMDGGSGGCGCRWGNWMDGSNLGG